MVGGGIAAVVVCFGPVESEEEEGVETPVRDFWRDACPFVPVMPPIS